MLRVGQTTSEERRDKGQCGLGNDMLCRYSARRQCLDLGELLVVHPEVSILTSLIIRVDGVAQNAPSMPPLLALHELACPERHTPP